MAEQGNFLGNLGRYLRKISKGSKDDPNSSWYLNAAAENGSDQLALQYATWPTDKLRSTIHDLISAAGIEDLDTVSRMGTEIEGELNDKFPLEHLEQFDFCIVCPQIDFLPAMAIKERLSAEFGLVGHVLWESIPLGADINDAFEDVLRRSTKIVFYVSENFDEYDFCCHLARNYLLEQGKTDSERSVIPLMKNYETEVPESLRLIDRLVFTNDLQFKFRFPAIFTEEIREKKQLRKRQCIQEIDSKRKAVLDNLVHGKVQTILQKDLSTLSDSSKSTGSKGFVFSPQNK